MISRRRFGEGGPIHARIGTYLTMLIGVIALSAGGAQASSALCVNQQGSGNSYSTIQGAIDAVSAADTTIIVQPGTYSAACTGPACSVAAIAATASNASSLSGLTLECGNGKRHRSVVLDATGLDHAVYVSGVNGVTVEGCVAENADREGILVEDASNAHVLNNNVTNNDQSMANAPSGCPTFTPPGTPIGPGAYAPQCCADAYANGPGNFPDDNDDCGEGIHLRSVIDSVVKGNHVHGNIGGILMTDETGPNKDNLIVGNNSSDNTEFGGDCGVTLASHLACAPGSTDATGCTPVTSGNMFDAGYGVTDNGVIGNVLNGNGASGAGAFANPGIPPGGETEASGNLIANNIVKNNGQPGIAIHVHAAGGSADDNTIVGNVVSGNGGDAEAIPTSTPKMGIEVLSNGNFPPFAPAEPIDGTTISQNKVSNEGVDVWVGNTTTDANVFLNDLAGRGAIGVDNGGNGTVAAPVNYWGCPHGPGAGGCSSASGNVETDPFLSHPANKR